MPSQVTHERRHLAQRTPGWLTDAEGEALHRWALTTVGPYLELGSYCGKSTVWIGDAAEQRGTHLIAVDWHRGSPRCDMVETSLTDLWATLAKAGLRDTVIPIAGTTSAVARYWRMPCSFTFIDACHDAPVLEDVRLWAPLTTDVLAFHDLDIPFVSEAIGIAQREFGWRLAETVDRLAVLTR